MTLLRSAFCLARDFGTAARLTPERRRRWLDQVRACGNRCWPDLPADARVQFDHRLRPGNDGLMLRGRVGDGQTGRVFWIKWSPEADEAALADTYHRLKWWRRRHPGLRSRSPDMLGYWPGEKLLLIEGRPGRPMGSLLARAGGDAESTRLRELLGAAEQLGRWLGAFAEGDPPYDTDVEPLLGVEARLSPEGRLTVDARCLIEKRIALANRAAAKLSVAGLKQAARWADRFDIDALLRAFGTSEPGGFVHGDVKPDNVLVDGEDFSVIDWWTAPRVSWPLPDVAAFVANLWMSAAGPAADHAGRRFVEAYFNEGPDERTREAMDLLGVMAGLLHVENKACSGLGKFVDRRRCSRLLDRLVDERIALAKA